MLKELSEYSEEALHDAEIRVKYQTYIQKERELAEKLNRLEHLTIPTKFDYHTLQALSVS